MGQSQIKPVEAKFEAISDFPVPTGKRQLMRFLGLVGYNRKFCNNFSIIAEPLTYLLDKRVKLIVRSLLISLRPYLKMLHFFWHQALIKNLCWP